MFGDGDRSTTATVIPLLFILLLAIALTAVFVYQVQFLPEEGKEQEITANRALLTDMLEFDFGVRRSFVRGESEPTSFGDNIQYPLAFPSPPEPVNSVYTAEEEPIILEGFTCVNGSECDPDGRVEVNTTPVLVTTHYNYLKNARSYGYEYGVVYSAPNATPEGSDAITTYTQPLLVQGDVVTLVAFQGDFSHHRRGTVPVTVKPSNSKVISYQITGDSGENLNITLPTELPEREWQELLANESNVGVVEDINYRNYTWVKEHDDEWGENKPGNANQDHWESCDHPGKGRPFVQCTKDNSTNYVTLTLDGSETYTVNTRIYSLSE